MKEVSILLVSLKKSFLANRGGYAKLFTITCALSIVSNISHNYIKSLEDSYIKTSIQIIQILVYTIAAYVNLYFFQNSTIKNTSNSISDISIAPIREAAFNYMKVLASQLIIALMSITALYFAIIYSISIHSYILDILLIIITVIIILFLFYWFIRLTFIGNITVLKHKSNKSNDIILESKSIIKEHCKATVFIYLINILLIAIGVFIIKINMDNWLTNSISTLISIIINIFSISAFVIIYLDHLKITPFRKVNELTEKIV